MKKINILFLLLLPMLLSSMWVRGEDVSIALNMPDTDMTVGEVADIPIYVADSFSVADVLSYTLQFSYNAYYLQIESVQVAGTIAAAFGEPAVKYGAGLITISGAGSVPLSGTGVFLKLRIRALNPGWIKLETTSDRMNLWNEGSPLMSRNFGYLKINSAQYFNVWSNTNLLAKGEKLHYSAGTNAPPVSWAVGNPALATIDTLGWLTALGPGKTIVVATDTNGVRGVSAELEIRPARISVQSTMEQWPGDTIDVPVWISDLSGLAILSGQIRMGFNKDILEPIGVIQSGTLLEGTMLETNVSDNQLSLVFAGTAPLPGKDTLLIVRFRVKPNPSGYSNIEFLNVRLNENVQVACSNGTFNVRQPSWRYIYPNEVSLIVGESAQFRVEGQGILPYVWKSSDQTLASVSSQGVLTALRRGSVVLTATDSAGISVSTQPLKIRDARILMPDTAVCYYSGMLRYPIRMDALPRFESILSLQSSLTYDTFYVSLDRMELAETVPSDWSLTTNESPESIRFAASGSTPLTQSGDLLYMWFRLKPNFNSGAWSSIQLGSWLFNEGFPTTLTDQTGTIQGKSKHAGYASITCDNQYWSCLHDTIRFHSQIWDAAPVQYQWLRNGVPILDANAPDLFTTALNHLDTVSCKVISLDPCIEDSVLLTNGITIYLKMPPVRPDSLTGDTLVFTGESAEYDVHLQNWDVQYNWQLPPGFVLNAGGSTIYVTVTDTARSGYVTVSTWNDCGMSEAVRLYVRVRTKPIIPDGFQIGGPEEVCAGERNLVYRIPPIANTDAYHWVLPDGFSGFSRADSIMVLAHDSATNGYLSVFYVFEKDTTYLAERYIEVKHRPESLGSIWGPETLFNQDSIMYTVNWNPDVEFFEWILPQGLDGPVTTTNWIRVAAQTTTLNGWIYVIGHGRCGVSDTARLKVAYFRDTTVYKPEILGPQLVCAGEDSLVYRLINCLDRYALSWELPAGMTGFSTTDTILVRVGETTVSDSLRVFAMLPIGKKLIASIFVEVSLMPGVMGHIVGPTLIKQPTDSVVYMVPQVLNAHFYLWMMPEGMWGWSETNIIKVHVADSSFTGMIYVRAFSWCGPGEADSLLVTVTKTVGIGELKEQEVLLYPNPFRDVLNLRVGMEAKLPDRLEIYDATGRLLNLKSVETSTLRTLDFSGRPAGIYLLKLMYSDSYKLFKVIKR